LKASTRDSKTGTIYVKVVNRAATGQPVHIAVSGVAAVEAGGQAITMSASNPADTNSITEPARIVPVITRAEGLRACQISLRCRDRCSRRRLFGGARRRTIR